MTKQKHFTAHSGQIEWLVRPTAAVAQQNQTTYDRHKQNTNFPQTICLQSDLGRSLPSWAGLFARYFMNL